MVTVDSNYFICNFIVPLVDYTKSTGTINNDTFSTEVLYQVMR